MKKLKLMLVLLACFVGSFAWQSVKAYTVYFVDDGVNWSTVKVYIHNDNGDSSDNNEGWPGATMTDSGKKYGGKTVLSYSFNPSWEPKRVIFNNGSGTQTGNMIAADGALYVLSTKDNTEGANPTELNFGGAEPTTHKAYIVNKSSWTTINAHIWESSEKATEWPGKSLTLTNTGKKYSGETVYSFEFKVDFTPKNIIFNSGSQTDDLTYGDGNLYVIGSGTHQTDNKDRQDCDTFAEGSWSFDSTPDPTYPDLYVVGEFTEEWEFRDRFKTSSTDGKYTWTFSAFPYVNQKWKIAADDYKIEYSAGDLMPQGNAPIRTIEFNKSYTCKIKRKGDAAGLGNMVLATSSDVTTTVTLDITTTPPTLSVATEGEIVRPEEYLTLYMSFGQDRITNGNRDEAPRIRFFNTKQTTGVDVPNLSDCTDARMEKVFPEETNSPLWKYTITRDQLSSVKDVMFYFYTKATQTNRNSNDHQQYIAGLATETRGSGADAFISDWDATNWTKYIYFADGDGRAAQSYMTFDDFLAEKNKTKRHLYIVGGGFVGLNGWQPMPENGNIDGKPTTLHVEAAGEAGNVFYQDVEVDLENLQTSEIKNEAGVVTDTNKGAKFKMSWVRPLDWYKANYPAGTTMDRQRSWATFNLGIVGYAQSHPAVISGKLPIITTTNGSNTEVYCTPGFIIPNNNYNQSDWFIREKYLSGDIKYTLVVDLDDKCQTACLLPCSPNPTVVADGISVETVSMEISDALNIWDNSSDRLSAETTNGKAVITDFNVVTATATVVAATHETIEGLKNPLDDTKSLNFKIAYEIYSGEDAVGTYEGKPARIRIEGVGLGSEADLGVRAIYRSGDTDLTFHSRRASSPITVGDGTTLPAPAIKGEITEKTFTGGTNMLDDEDSPRYTLGAYALVPVTAPAMTSGRDYKWYADFELTTNGHHIDHPQHANGGEVVGTDHPATKLNAVTISSVAYTPWAEGSEYTADNNWSAKLAATDAWPLHLPEVVEVKRTYKDESKKQFEETTPKATVNVNVYAVYPFLTDPQAKPQVVSSETPAAAPARKITINPDHNYVVKLAKSNATTATFSLGSGDLTAVRDIIAPQAPEAEAEYYNLQGVRVRGELTPGIYVRRCGSVAEKVVVR